MLNKEISPRASHRSKPHTIAVPSQRGNSGDLAYQVDRSQREAMEQEAEVVAALENARAQFYRGATLLTAAVFAEDAVPFVDSYRQAQVEGDRGIERARSTLAEIGETEQIAALDSFAEQMGQLARM